jgi:hypothetical protein
MDLSPYLYTFGGVLNSKQRQQTGKLLEDILVLSSFEFSL